MASGGKGYDASKKSTGPEKSDAEAPAWMRNAQWISIGDQGGESADSSTSVDPADVLVAGGPTKQATKPRRSRGGWIALITGIATAILVVVAMIDITYLVFFASKPAPDEPTAAPSASAEPEAAPSVDPSPAPFGDPTATVSVIGTQCLPGSSPHAAADGSVVYCEPLQATDLFLWSLVPQEIPPPVGSEDPAVGVCMNELGRTAADCVEYLQRPSFPGDGGVAPTPSGT